MTGEGAVLVTGGTGQTGRVVASLVRQAGREVVVASRGAEPEGVRFDWADPGSHRAALSGVDSVYLVPPPLEIDPSEVVARFLDLALEEGVRRAVLLNSSAFPASAKGLRRVREVVRRMPEWSVLLAGGFMQNFTGAHPHANTIRELGEIEAAAGAGRMGYIDAADIAATAAVLLTRPGHVSAEHVLTGPEALGYNDIAAVIAAESGWIVRYRAVSAAERADTLAGYGYPPEFVDVLVGADVLTAGGAEDRTTDEVATITGTAPQSFAEFAREHRAAWL